MKILKLIGLAVVLPLLLASCGGGGSGGGSGANSGLTTVTINLGQVSGGSALSPQTVSIIPSEVYSITIGIYPGSECGGATYIGEVINVSGGDTVSRSYDVPPGSWCFGVNAYDSDDGGGTMIYQGHTPATVGSTAMSVAVSMAKLAQEFSVWTGKARAQSSCCTTVTDNLHFHMWAPQGDVNNVVATGPGISGSLTFTPDATSTRSGIITDELSSGGNTDFTAITAPLVNDTYTFTVTWSDSSTTVYTQTLTQVVSDPLIITLPSGFTLGNANLGGTLSLEWTNPSSIESYLDIDDLYISGKSCNGGCSDTVVGSVATLTTGSINLPDPGSPISAFVDVRIHYNDEVMTSCHHDFNGGE